MLYYYMNESKAQRQQTKQDLTLQRDATARAYADPLLVFVPSKG